MNQYLNYCKRIRSHRPHPLNIFNSLIEQLSKNLKNLPKNTAIFHLIGGAFMISFSGVWVKISHVTPTVSAFYRVLFGGLFLLAAGIYQFSPLKNRCLMLCRSPAAFLSAHWRRGPAGALRMGVEHGFYCVGCCWSLMLLLFVGGIMNLVWIAGLAIFVLLEKLLPRGDWLARASGGLMIAVGGYLLLA